MPSNWPSFIEEEIDLYGQHGFLWIRYVNSDRTFNVRTKLEVFVNV